MISRVIAASLLLPAFALILAGCGENTVTTAGSSKLVQSEVCFNNCHQNAISPGSGKNITAEWKLSVHNTSNAAGCADCHDPEPGHPSSCNRCHGGTPSGSPDSTNHVSKNPDTDGKCDKCHAKNDSNSIFNTTVYDGVSQDTKFNHYSSGSRRPNYVATNYQQNCRKCHNPHDTTTAKTMLQQWARSGMALIPTTSRSGSSLPASANYGTGSVCVRCHTSTGYVNFVTSNFTNIHALPDLDGAVFEYPSKSTSANPDTTHEPTAACDTCHSDGRYNDGSAYSGKLRLVPKVSIYYNMSTHAAGGSLIRTSRNIVYDDLGYSNVCMPCHAGREVGEVIKDQERNGLFSYTGNAPGNGITVSGHDFNGGANLEGRSGFHFYTSVAKYAFNPAHKVFSTTIGGANGACIGCHMTNDRSHYFLPVTWNGPSSPANSTNSITAVLSEPTVCIKCHDGSATGGARRDVNYLNTQRINYRAAASALNALLPTGSNGSQWKTFGNYTVAGSGKLRAAAYTMGASFNYNLFGSITRSDPAAYVHNPTYTKQLIYDSIDWIVYNRNHPNTKTFVGGTSAADIFNAITAISPTSSFFKYTIDGIAKTYTPDQALSFICKGYISGVSTTCERY